jgi:predicted NAD/FAD-dependent oxidoreductase
MSNPEARADAVVVGAGISGSACARELSDHGATVVVVDKGRGPGGRMSTRRTESGSFDHGAQYVTVRNPRFRQKVDEWQHRGIFLPWRGRFAKAESGRLQAEANVDERYVGVPGMNAIVRDLQKGLDVRFRARATSLQRDSDGWTVRCEDGTACRAAAVVVSTPAPQAVPLLEGVSAFAEVLRQVRVSPCWAVMASFAAPLEVAFDGIKFADGPLSWAARDSSKPGRAQGERWVLHTAPAWATEHLNDEPARVAETLVQVFADACAIQRPRPSTLSAHRWLYALVTQPVGEDSLWDPDLGIGVCGDGCRGGRVEDAYLSGLAVAERMKAS